MYDPYPSGKQWSPGHVPTPHCPAKKYVVGGATEPSNRPFLLVEGVDDAVMTKYEQAIVAQEDTVVAEEDARKDAEDAVMAEYDNAMMAMDDTVTPPLPDGWVEETDPGSGRMYYCNQ